MRELSDYNLNKMEDCVEFLIDTIDTHAEAKARAKAAEYLLKAHRSEAYINSDGKTIADREAQAAIAIVHLGHVSEYKNALREYEIVSARRAVAELQLELYRTKSANIRGLKI